jgi:phage tail-like protein
MPTIINNRSTLTTDPIRNFRFLVTFKPHSVAGVPAALKNSTLGFVSVSGLAVTTESIPYREGGYNTTVHQIPGQTTFQPINLVRGVQVGTSQNWEWMRKLFATVQGGAQNVQGESFRCDLEIAVLSHPIPGSAGGTNTGNVNNINSADNDHVALRFNVYNAWVTAVAYSDLNAADNALFVESMTLVHEGFDVNWATGVAAGTGAATFDNVGAGR